MYEEVCDYNGIAEWSAPSIQERYGRYARELGLSEFRDIAPREHVQGNIRWVYPIMDEVIKGIKAQDPACIDIGVEFIEHGPKQPFGRILHSNTARALRQHRASLSNAQIERLRRRILGMLVDGEVPHEYKEYAKLLKRIGVGPDWPDVLGSVDRANPYVLRYVTYLADH